MSGDRNITALKYIALKVDKMDIYVCVCVCVYWSSYHGSCLNYDVVGFLPQAVATTLLYFGCPMLIL